MAGPISDEDRLKAVQELRAAEREDEIERRQFRAQSYEMTNQSSPDEAAEALDLGEKFGVPRQAIELDRDIWRKRDLDAQRRLLQSASPRTMAWLDNADNHAVAKDDIDVWGDIEGAVSSFAKDPGVESLRLLNRIQRAGYAGVISAESSWTSDKDREQLIKARRHYDDIDAWKAREAERVAAGKGGFLNRVGIMSKDLGTQRLYYPGDTDPMPRPTVRLLEEAMGIGRPSWKAALGLPGAAYKADQRAAILAVKPLIEDKLTEAIAESKRKNQLVADLTPTTGNFTADALLGGVRSIAEMGPLMIAAITTKGRTIHAGIMGGQVYYNEFAEGMDRGLDIDRATNRALLQAGVETVSERISLGIIDDVLLKQGSPVWRRFVGSMVLEQAQEQVATLGNRLVDWSYLTPEMTIQQFFDETPRYMVQTALTTLVASAGMQATFLSADYATRKFFGDARSAEPTTGHQTLAKLMERLGASKLAGRSPKKAGELAEKIVADTGLETVVVDLDGLSEALSQEGQDVRAALEALGVQADAIGELGQIMGQVEIPVRNLAAAGVREMSASVLPHLKTKGDDYTPAQQAELKDGLEKLAARTSKEIRGDMERDATFSGQVIETEEQIYESLVQIGRPATESRANAVLKSRMFASAAKRRSEERGEPIDIAGFVEEFGDILVGPDGQMPVSESLLPQITKAGGLKSAAVRYKGKTYTGPDHDAAAQAASAATGDAIDSIVGMAGYVDAKGRYYSRDSLEAVTAALAADQITDPAVRRILEMQVRNGRTPTLTSGMVDGLAQTAPNSIRAAMQMTDEQVAEWYMEEVTEDVTEAGDIRHVWLNFDMEGAADTYVKIQLDTTTGVAGVDVFLNDAIGKSINGSAAQVAAVRLFARSILALRHWSQLEDVKALKFTGASASHDKLYNYVLSKVAIEGYTPYRADYASAVLVTTDDAVSASPLFGTTGFYLIRDGEKVEDYVKEETIKQPSGVSSAIRVADISVPGPAAGEVVAGRLRVGGPDTGGETRPTITPLRPEADPSLNQLIGPKARSANKAILNTAKRMAKERVKAGKGLLPKTKPKYTRQQIWDETAAMGQPWYQDQNGEWISEIEDGSIVVREGKGKLGEVIEFPSLYAEYPEMARMTADTRSNKAVMEDTGDPGVPGTKGVFTPRPFLFGVNVRISDRGSNSREYTVTHELQHAVDHIEGREMGRKKKYLFRDTERRAFNTMYRRLWTMEERIATPPWKTEQEAIDWMMGQRDVNAEAAQFAKDGTFDPGATVLPPEQTLPEALPDENVPDGAGQRDLAMPGEITRGIDYGDGRTRVDMKIYAPPTAMLGRTFLTMRDAIKTLAKFPDLIQPIPSTNEMYPLPAEMLWFEEMVRPTFENGIASLESDEIKYKELSIVGDEVLLGGLPVNGLSAKEIELLRLLMANPEGLVSFESAARHLYGPRADRDMVRATEIFARKVMNKIKQVNGTSYVRITNGGAGIFPPTARAVEITGDTPEARAKSYLAPGRMLDMDKLVDQQPASVRAFFEAMIAEQQSRDDLLAGGYDYTQPGYFDGLTVGALMTELAQAQSAESGIRDPMIAMIQRLRAAGIIGAKYVPGGIRDDGAPPVQSIVIFDERAPVLLTDQSGNLMQDRRGGFDPATRQMMMSDYSDVSTYMHESAHWYLDMVEKFAAAGEQWAQQDVDEIYAWFDKVKDTPKMREVRARYRVDFESGGFRIVYQGPPDLMGEMPEPMPLEWRATEAEAQARIDWRERHEALAESFEEYLMTGKAPTPGLVGVMNKFKQWLLDIYRGMLPGERANLNADIRMVFDRMLAVDVEVDAASAEAFRDADTMAKEMLEKGIITARQYRLVGERLNKARDEVKAEMLALALEEENRKNEDWWETERLLKKGNIARPWDKSPLGRAFNWLAYGEWKGDLVEAPEDKFDNPEVVFQTIRTNADRIAMVRGAAGQEIEQAPTPPDRRRIAADLERLIRLVDRLVASGQMDAAIAGHDERLRGMLARVEQAPSDTLHGQFLSELRAIEATAASAGARDIADEVSRIREGTGREAQAALDYRGILAQSRRVFETPGSPEYEAAVAKGLDMSTPARMARAKEMGFDTETVLYHGTRNHFDAFEAKSDSQRPLWGKAIYLSDNPDVASAYSKNPYYGVYQDWDDFSGTNQSSTVLPLLIKGKILQKTFDGTDKSRTGTIITDGIKEARENGYAGVVIRGIQDFPRDIGSQNIYVIFDPSNTRSIHAAFDPDSSGSSNLLAQSAPASGYSAIRRARDAFIAQDVISEQIAGEAPGSMTYGFRLSTGAVIVDVVNSEEFGAQQVSITKGPTLRLLTRTPEEIDQTLREMIDRLSAIIASRAGNGPVLIAVNDRADIPLMKEILKDAAPQGHVIRVVRNHVYIIPAGASINDDTGEVSGAGRFVPGKPVGRPSAKLREQFEGRVQSQPVSRDHFAGSGRSAGPVPRSPFLAGVKRRLSDTGLRQSAVVPSTPAPTFYSALSRFITNHTMPRAPAAQWKGIIQNAPGIKGEEIEWTGAMEWLDTQDGPVSRDDLAAFVAANKLGKKYGARVEKKTFDIPEFAFGLGLHTFPITPELREAAINQGFPLFQNRTFNPPGHGPVTPPEDMTPIRLDLRAVEELHGKDAVRKLPAAIRRRSDTSSNVDELMATIETARKALKTKGPQTLIEFIRKRKVMQQDGSKRTRKAGIKGAADELRAIGLESLINEKSGMDIDHVREAAEEAGFISPKDGDTQTTIADLLDALDREARGTPVIRPDDTEAAIEREAAEAWAKFFDDMDVDMYEPNPRKLRASLAKAVGRFDELLVTPDQAAEGFGFENGEELLAALAEVGNRDKHLDRLADEAMIEEFGDMMRDGTLQAEAEEAARLKILGRQTEIELEALARAVGVQASTNYARSLARDIIAQRTVKEIAGHQRDLDNERRFAKQALRLVEKGDYQGALRAKQQQMMSAALYTEGKKAYERIEKTRKDLLKYLTSEGRRDKIARDYLDKIEGILETYELRVSKQGPAEQRRRLSAKEYVDQMIADGREAEIAPEARLLAEAAGKERWRDMTAMEVDYLAGTVRNLAHLGRTKDSMMRAQEKRRFAAVIDSLVDRMNQTGKLPGVTRERSPTRTGTEIIVDTLREGHSWLFRPEHQARALDMGEVGPIWDALFRPMADASDVETRMMRDATALYREAWSKFTMAERNRMSKVTISVPELPALGKRFTRLDMISIALNWGVQYNRDVLLEGYGWTADQVEAALNRTLDDSHWDFIESIWEISGMYKAEAFALEKDMTGVEPKAVEGMDFTLASGRVIEGKYYHIDYDARQPGKAGRRQEKDNNAEALASDRKSRTKAMTRNGGLIERKGSGGRKVKLGLDVFEKALTETIHDIAFRRAVYDVGRIVSNDAFADTYQEVAGMEAYRQLNVWLKDIAMPPSEALDPIVRAFAHVRRNIPLAVMGYKIGTAMIQPSGLLAAMPIVGHRRLIMAVVKSFANPQGSIYGSWQKVAEMSEFMRDRVAGYERDVRETTTAMTKGGWSGIAGIPLLPLDFMRRNAFVFITGMDIAVSVPTWMAAYGKAMDGKVKGVDAGNQDDAIAFADSVVRRTQTAGKTQDLSSFQRGGEFQKQISMIFGYFNNLYSLSAQQTLDMRRGGISRAHYAWHMTVLFVMIPLFAEMLAGRLIPDDDDEETLESKMAQTVLLNFTGMFPGIRDAVAVNVKPEFGYRLSPTSKFVEDIARTAGLPAQLALDPERELTEADVRRAVNSVGALTGLPAAQINITGNYIIDVLEGEEDPTEDPADAAREALIRNTR